MQTILGHGIDCHMLGLRNIAAEKGLPIPEVFKDQGYTKSNHFSLSTSQVWLCWVLEKIVKNLNGK